MSVSDTPAEGLHKTQLEATDKSTTNRPAEPLSSIEDSLTNESTSTEPTQAASTLQMPTSAVPILDGEVEPLTQAGAYTIPAATPHPHDDTSSLHGSVITADEFDDDEGYAQSTNTSYVTSLASSIRRGVEENGRVYASYGRNEYGMPIDETAQEHNDLNHAKFCLLMGNQLFLAPIGPEPQNVLDLGTGSGIWAMDMADMFPSAHVIGTDIAPVQPTWVPPNCQFEIEDVEDDWIFPLESFDYIHARELIMSVRDWPRLMSQSFERLKPGGWLELGLTNPRTCCDDGSLNLETSQYVESAKIFFQMAEAMGTPLDAPNSWKSQMEAIGFEDVQEVWLKLPMGPWAKDKRLKQVGMFELKSLNDGFEGYLIRGYTQFLKRPADELRALLAYARKEINDPKNHTYVHFIVVYGRKPGGHTA